MRSSAWSLTRQLPVAGGSVGPTHVGECACEVRLSRAPGMLTVKFDRHTPASECMRRLRVCECLSALAAGVACRRAAPKPACVPPVSLCCPAVCASLPEPSLLGGAGSWPEECNGKVPVNGRCTAKCSTGTPYCAVPADPVCSLGAACMHLSQPQPLALLNLHEKGTCVIITCTC